MEISQISIAKNQLPTRYRQEFMFKVIEYVFHNADVAIESKLNNLVKLHNGNGIVFNGMTHYLPYVTLPKLSTILPVHIDEAIKLFSDRQQLSETIEFFKSAAIYALSICKTSEDVKLMFTSDIYEKCKPSNTPEYGENISISENILKSFNEKYPDFTQSIKQQLLSNLLMY